jgi:hypothetical protein
MFEKYVLGPVLYNQPLVHDASSDEFAFASFCIANRHLMYSQRLQDLWVLYETKCKEGGTFLDFGAGNGRDASNSYILHRKFGWDGMLIEPNSDYHDNIKHHISPGVHFLTGVAVAATEANDVEFFVCNDPSISTMVHAIDSDDHGKTRRDLKGEVRKIITIPLKTVIFDMFVNIGFDKLTYLSIDTEGTEPEILGAYFSSPTMFPMLITVEHNYNHTSRTYLHDLLTRHGYERKFTEYSGHDDWYRLKQ